jgi:hypothetical protein
MARSCTESFSITDKLNPWTSNHLRMRSLCCYRFTCYGTCGTERDVSVLVRALVGSFPVATTTMPEIRSRRGDGVALERTRRALALLLGRWRVS